MGRKIIAALLVAISLMAGLASPASAANWNGNVGPILKTNWRMSQGEHVAHIGPDNFYDGYIGLTKMYPWETAKLNVECDNKVVWTRDMSNAGFLLMQPDGNLVAYNVKSYGYGSTYREVWTAIWASNTAGNPGAQLYAQSDGNIVIYQPFGGRALWATGTVCANYRNWGTH